MKALKSVEVKPKASLPRRPLPQLAYDIDKELSNRHIDLDPAGYFLIKIERTGSEPHILAEFFTNTINQDGASPRAPCSALESLCVPVTTSCPVRERPF